MKINLHGALALTAAATALILGFLSPEILVSLAAVAGILSVFNSDVGRTIEPV
jgi:hypothetical protein